MTPNFAYVRPGDLKQAVARARRDGARVHAGGTDLLGCLRDGVFGAEVVVSLGGLSDLRGIRAARGGGLRLGALATITEVEEHDEIRRRHAVLAQAAAAVGSPQLRHQGTIGGNVCQKPRCWYYRGEFHCLRKGGDQCYAVGGQNQYHCILGGDGCFIVHPSDPAVALVALDAEIEAAGPDGSRRIPAAGFHVPPSRDPRRETVLEPGEIVTGIFLPAPPAGRVSRYRKVRARQAWDFALVSTALALDLDGDAVRRARVALGGVAPVPWRSEAAEAELTGKALDGAAIGRAVAAATADADPLEHNGYKVPLLREVLAQELRACRP